MANFSINLSESVRVGTGSPSILDHQTIPYSETITATLAARAGLASLTTWTESEYAHPSANLRETVAVSEQLRPSQCSYLPLYLSYSNACSPVAAGMDYIRALAARLAERGG